MSTTPDLPPLPEKRPISGQAGLNCVIWGKGHDDETLEAYAREAVRLDRASRVGAGWRCFHCDETFTDEVRAGEHFGNRPDGRPPSCIGLHEWAVACWREQVEHRSLANDYRRTLDTVWRQVLRFAGGSPDEVLGPSHDELCSRLTTNAYLALAAAPSTPPDEATSRDAEPQIGETWHILRSGALACATVKIAAMTDKTVTFESGIYGIDNECLPRAKFAFVERVDAARTQGDAA